VLSLVVVLAIAYVLGSLPFSLWAGRLLRGIDLRSVGSGNLGATNVLRSLGWRAAAPVLALDIGKGAVAVVLARRLVGAASPVPPDIVPLLAGVAAVAGHMWTPFAGFRGGKGVATAAGVFLSLAPLPTALSAALFALLTGVTRYVSLGSVAAAAAFPVFLALVVPPSRTKVPLLIVGLLVVATIVWKHRENIRRLLKGTESRIGGRGPAHDRGR
jgi:glycerol-3-phosphate acyltransferase PlsY